MSGEKSNESEESVNSEIENFEPEKIEGEEIEAQIIEIEKSKLEKLIELNKSLIAENIEFRNDFKKTIQTYLKIAEMLGIDKEGNLSPARAIQRVMMNINKIKEIGEPFLEVIGKYLKAYSEEDEERN